MKIRKKDALDYHSQSPKGKVEVNATKPVSTQRDLSLAYSPGVAVPCLEIARDKELVYEYTAKENLVAVLTNGTAVLGLGNIGPEASKPVMEGKGVLFKKFAGIDVFDIEINATTVEEFVAVAKALEPTFGAINIEDVAAPESFEIERRMVEEMNIPVMHDDQHGTAIISAAALVNGLRIVDKKIEDIKIVCIGAGAAAIACANLYLKMGVKLENFSMYDSGGLLYAGREDVNEYGAKFAQYHTENRDLIDSFKDADVMLGLAKGGIVSKDMVKRMAANPIVLALANPDPEITWEDCMKARPDAVMATGRSDYPNQVNNALGFPYIFRGALDVRATSINEEMKVAAATAIAELAYESVPEDVMEAYDVRDLSFGREYLIPKLLDPRLIVNVSSAVARAAMESGVARKPIEDFDAYAIRLRQRLGHDESLTRNLMDRAKKEPKRVVFGDADTYKILKAAQILSDEGIAEPILLGNREKIDNLISENNLDIGHITVIDPLEEKHQRYIFAEKLFEKRQRRGITLHDARKLMRERSYYGTMMVETGMAEAFISGITKNYPNSIRPALQVIGRAEETDIVAGMHVIRTKRGPLFFADTTVNKRPSVENLVDIATLVHKAVRRFNIQPRLAMLSYSNFGSNMDDETAIVVEATRRLQKEHPHIVVDGDIQANVAVRPDIISENYGFSDLADTPGANTFIFPNLMASNIAYKMMNELGDAEIIGPILLGMKKPVHILQLGSSVNEIVNIAALAVVDAQILAREGKR